MRRHRVIFAAAIMVIAVICGVLIYDGICYLKMTSSGVFDVDEYRNCIEDFEEYVVYDPLPHPLHVCAGF